MINTNTLMELIHMPKIDYEKYLVRKPLYEAFGGTKNRQSPTMTMMSNKQVPGSNYYMEPGWIYGIPDPNPSLHEHVHDFDEIVMHMGGDYRTPQVLGGEVEFYVGGQPITFNTPTAFCIPKGTPHGPVIWKKFQFPHLQMAIMCGTGSAGEAWGARARATTMLLIAHFHKARCATEDPAIGVASGRERDGRASIVACLAARVPG
jgi:hypothetical protein